MFDNVATLKYSNDALRRLIGPLGALKRKIEDETGLIEALECFVLLLVNLCHIWCMIV